MGSLGGSDDLGQIDPTNSKINQWIHEYKNMQTNLSYSNDIIPVPKSVALLVTLAFISMLGVTFQK
jgi:hypothetical protein